MALDLRHMRYFLAVAEEGQISRAAKRLYLAQPALSQSLRRLEADLGVKLFHRHGRGVTLTRSGEQFLANARKVLATFDEAVITTRIGCAAEAGALVLGFLPPMLDPAAHLVERFQAAHPQMTLHWQPLDFATQDSDLRSGLVDIAFLWVPRDDPDIGFLPIATEPRGVLMSAAHPLASRRALRFADIADEPHPSVAPGVPQEWADFWCLADVRGHRPRVTSEAPMTVEHAWALVASGKAITTAPHGLARAYARAGVVARPLIDVPPAVLAAAWRKQDAGVTVERFLAFAAAPAA